MAVALTLPVVAALVAFGLQVFTEFFFEQLFENGLEAFSDAVVDVLFGDFFETLFFHFYVG